MPFTSSVDHLGKATPAGHRIRNPDNNDLECPKVQQPPGLILSLLVPLPLVSPTFPPPFGP
jgi:hypothetical protein